MVEENATNLAAGLIINKVNQDSLLDLQKQLKGILKRYTSKSHIDFKELNTFLFVRALFDNQVVNNTEIRKNIERQLLAAYKKYIAKEIADFTKSIRKNVEIIELVEIVKQLIHRSNTANREKVENQVIEKAAEISDRSNHIVSEIMKNTYCIIWDFDGKESGKVIFPNIVIEEHAPSEKSLIRISTLIENLTAIQFAKICMEQLSLMLSSVEFAIDDISAFFAKEENKAYLLREMNTQLFKSLRVIFGLLSSTQQVLSDIHKQLKRIEGIKIELNKELEFINFAELAEYIAQLDQQIYCDKLKVKIDYMLQAVKTTSKNLLDLINTPRTIPDKINNDMSSFVNVFSFALSELQTLKFYTNKFRDLAFFQAIPPNVEKELVPQISVDEHIILKAEALFKTYRLATSTVYALRGVDLELKKGEMVAVVGPSGSGKTTLLNLLAGLDTPDRGAVFLFGKNIRLMSDSEISLLRRRHMGFIFQYYNLIPQLTVLENVMLPGLMIGRSAYEVKQEALAILQEVGLAHYRNKLPIKLSGGEMQRVTIARSVINSPAILFADEPTGDLDSQTGKIVVDLIRRLSKEKNMAVLFVTHDLEMAETCDKVIKIEDGRIVA